MSNRKSQARTKADSEQKDEALFVSQHSSKPHVACSFSSTETKNEIEEIKAAFAKGLGHTKVFINNIGQPFAVTTFNEYPEEHCLPIFFAKLKLVYDSSGIKSSTISNSSLNDERSKP